MIDTTSKATVFAPGVVSSPYTEWATSFAPDAKTVYFSRGAIYWTIVSSKFTNNAWQKPEVASFSGKWNDTDPFISPDGKRLFFISNRPVKEASQDKPMATYHIWYVDNANDKWTEPQHLPADINIEGSSNYAATVSAKGSLYWCSRDRQGNKGMQGYYAEWLGDHYGPAKKINISGVDEVQDPFIAADESYLVFLSGNDIYTANRDGEGWSAAQKLPVQVNNGDANSSPYVSPDGKTLYYSSSRIQGFYKRDRTKAALNFDQLEKENNGLFNSQPNILMIPVKIVSK